MYLDQGFLAVALLTLWIRLFSIVGGCPVPSRIVSSISGLYSLDARIISLVVTNKNVSGN